MDREPNSSVVSSSDMRTLNTILTLKNLNINIKHGEFVCIIGDVGSGKSSILSSIIGDLLYLSPKALLNNENVEVTE